MAVGVGWLDSVQPVTLDSHSTVSPIISVASSGVLGRISRKDGPTFHMFALPLVE
jgi:hypothetical protein